MDQNNIIDLSTDLNDLELDMKNWLNLTYDQRKRADQDCIEKYGCTNIELYNKQKAHLVKTDDAESFNEAIFTPMDDYLMIADFSMEARFNKIRASRLLQTQDKNIIIIDDFVNDNNPDYGLIDLENKYESYKLLSPLYKGFSNDNSIKIWNKSVVEMYIYMKAKLNKNKSIEDRIKISRRDQDIKQYSSELEESAKYGDIISCNIHKISCLTTESSLYESAILEDKAETTKLDLSTNYDGMIPMTTPFLDPDEYQAITGNEIHNPFDYVIVHDQNKYFNTIKQLLDEVETNETTVQTLTKLGWNPYVSLTTESMKYARTKQINWLNENNRCNIIDLSNFEAPNIISESFDENKILEPIYVILTYTGTTFGKVITKFQHCKFSHAGIALRSKLDQIFTFNMRTEIEEVKRKNKTIEKKEIKGGADIETLDDYHNKEDNNDADICVMCIFVDPAVKKAIQENIDKFFKNVEKTKYAISNVFNIVINRSVETGNSMKMICSQFVDNILKMANIDLTNKSSNLVSPNDFMKASKTNPNIYVLYDGKKSKYNSKSVDGKVSYIKRTNDYITLNVVKPKEVSVKLAECKLENFFITCPENAEISCLLKEMRDYIRPSAVIVEAKFPIKFNHQGDLSINLPKDLQAEYNEAHKLLYTYNESNLQGIKNELARLFMINSIIEKKLKKMDKTNSQYKELIDLRARILNDYTTYLKIVIAAEPNFDFTKYFATTDYYNKSITIDNTTLKYSGSIVKKLLKSILRK